MRLKRGRMRAAFFRRCVSLLSNLLCQSITFSMLSLGVFPVMGFLPRQENCALSWNCLSHAQRGLRTESMKPTISVIKLVSILRYYDFQFVTCCMSTSWWSVIMAGIITATLSLSFRSGSSDNLDVLSRKLQSIQDIDELTKMVSINRQKFMKYGDSLYACPVNAEILCVFVWSSVPPASMRRGRWSERPSDKSEMNSSKVSPAVTVCLLNRVPLRLKWEMRLGEMHLFTYYTNVQTQMWHWPDEGSEIVG